MPLVRDCALPSCDQGWKFDFYVGSPQTYFTVYILHPSQQPRIWQFPLCPQEKLTGLDSHYLSSHQQTPGTFSGAFARTEVAFPRERKNIYLEVVGLTLCLQYLFFNKVPSRQPHLLFKTLGVVSSRREKLHHILLHQQNGGLKKLQG